MSFFEELVALIPPPVDTKPHTEAEWVELEAKLGSRLPPDYKMLINRYGAGYFCSLLIIHSPFMTADYFATSQEWLREIHENSKERSSREPFDLTVFPEPGGLLYFASDRLNGFLCWKTEGMPEDWTLVIANDRLLTREEFPMSLTEFILRFARNEVKVEKYSEEPPMEPTFDPIVRWKKADWKPLLEAEGPVSNLLIATSRSLVSGRLCEDRLG